MNMFLKKMIKSKKNQASPNIFSTTVVKKEYARSKKQTPDVIKILHPET
jgi:hypothetical protein